MRGYVVGALLNAWAWLVIHDACFCRLGPLGRRICGWIHAHAWEERS